MKKFTYFIILLFFLLNNSGCTQVTTQILSGNKEETAVLTPGIKVKASINYCHDGDTCVVRINDSSNGLKGEYTIRVLNIDTPEKSGNKAKKGPQPFAEAATARGKELLEEKEVQLELSLKDNPYDKYGRLLANIWIDEDTLYQEVLLREGLARMAYVYEPDTQYIENRLKPAQQKAKDNNINIWSMPGYVTEKGFNP